jgi:hypothetical protein
MVICNVEKLAAALVLPVLVRKLKKRTSAVHAAPAGQDEARSETQGAAGPGSINE